MSDEAGGLVRTILPTGQSETARLFRVGPFYTRGEYPALAAENATVVVNAVNRPGGGDGPLVVEVTQGAIEARLVTPAMVALANLWHEARPGEALWVLDGTVSGTSFGELVSDAQPKRDWADYEAVVLAARAHGHEVDDVVWDWYNSTASQWKTLGPSYAPGLFGQTWDGATYDLARGPVNHTLFDADAGVDEPGRGLFARADTRLTVMSPGPSPEAGMEPRFNFTHHADGSWVNGRSKQLDRGAMEAGAELVADPRLGPARGANGPSPIVVKFGDYEGGAKLPGGDTAIHPSGWSPYGAPLWAMHVGVAALMASGDAAEPAILGQSTSADGRHTDVVFSLPNGGVLSTLRKVMGHVSPDPEPADHQHAEGTGFELRRPGDGDAGRQPVWRPSAPGRDAGHGAEIAILDPGSGAGAGRTATVRLSWAEPVPEGSVLEYLRGGHFSAQLTAEDYDRELWADFLVEHVPAWFDGTAFGYPGVPVRPQPPVATMTLRRGESTVPDGAGPAVPTPPEPQPEPQPEPDPQPEPASPPGGPLEARNDALWFTASDVVVEGGRGRIGLDASRLLANDGGHDGRIAILRDAMDGSVALSPDGSALLYRFRLDGFDGKDAFSYSAFGAGGARDHARVYLEVDLSKGAATPAPRPPAEPEPPTRSEVVAGHAADPRLGGGDGGGPVAVREAAGYTRGALACEVFVLGARRADVASGREPDAFVFEALGEGKAHRVRDYDGDLLDLSLLVQRDAAAGGPGGVVRIEHVVWAGAANAILSVDPDGGGDGFERAAILRGADPALTAAGLLADGLLVL